MKNFDQNCKVILAEYMVFKGKEFTFVSKRLRKRGLQEFTVDDPFFYDKKIDNQIQHLKGH